MNVRTVLIAGIAAAALAPAISNASPESVSLAACAQAFAAHIVTPGAGTLKYRVAYLGETTGSALSLIYSREYTFEMQAKDRKSGMTIARGSCSARRDGVVTALSSSPIGAPNEKFASQF
jgi:hypothetical protein